MYGEDFFNRTNWQQICDFLRYGSETMQPPEAGTLEERAKRHEAAFIAAMKSYRTAVVSTNWAAVPADRQVFEDEKLSMSVFHELASIEELAFEAGFSAGLRLAGESPCR